MRGRPVEHRAGVHVSDAGGWWHRGIVPGARGPVKRAALGSFQNETAVDHRRGGQLQSRLSGTFQSSGRAAANNPTRLPHRAVPSGQPSSQPASQGQLGAGGPDVIAMGSMKVMIMGQPAARMGDQTAHGGVITLGYPTVMIN